MPKKQKLKLTTDVDVKKRNAKIAAIQAGEEEKPHRKYKLKQSTIFKRDHKKQVIASWKGKKTLPFQRSPMVRVIRKSIVDRCGDDEVSGGLRLTQHAQDAILESVSDFLHNFIKTSYNISKVAGRRKTLQVKDQWLALTGNPMSVAVIGTGDVNSIAGNNMNDPQLKSFTFTKLNAVATGEGDVIKTVRSGKIGKAVKIDEGSKEKKEKKGKKTSAKKTGGKKAKRTGRKKKEEDAMDVDPEATVAPESQPIVPGEAPAAAEEKEDEDASVDEEEEVKDLND